MKSCNHARRTTDTTTATALATSQYKLTDSHCSCGEPREVVCQHVCQASHQSATPALDSSCDYSSSFLNICCRISFPTKRLNYKLTLDVCLSVCPSLQPSTLSQAPSALLFFLFDALRLFYLLLFFLHLILEQAPMKSLTK